MSASDNGPDGRKERYPRGATFLRAARHLPELTPAQIDRIERHLNRGRPVRVRRPILSPALATLVVVLVAGTALAVAGMNLTRLPGIGPWIGALFPPAPAHKASANGRPRRADGADPSDAPGVEKRTSPSPIAAPGGAASARPSGANNPGLGGNPSNPAGVGSPPIAATLAAPATHTSATPADRVPPLPAERAPAPPFERALALPAAHPPGRPARVEVAPSTGWTTSASARPRRRQPEATVAWAAAAPAGERNPLASASLPDPSSVSATIETAATDTASAARLASPPAPPLPTTPPAAGPPPGPPATGRAPGAHAGTSPSPSLSPSSSSTVAPPPAAAAESPIVADSRSFAAALERWHRDHDGKAALAALDAHERRFPAGEFRLEAQLLRAEILLAGGHEREGLALLDPLALAGLPRARELRTVRGELRVKFGRCPEGKTDLAAVLAESGNDPLAQRARQALVDCP